jgi:hypothetical protein
LGGIFTIQARGFLRIGEKSKKKGFVSFPFCTVVVGDTPARSPNFRIRSRKRVPQRRSQRCGCSKHSLLPPFLLNRCECWSILSSCLGLSVCLFVCMSVCLSLPPICTIHMFPGYLPWFTASEAGCVTAGAPSRTFRKPSMMLPYGAHVQKKVSHGSRKQQQEVERAAGG